MKIMSMKSHYAQRRARLMKRMGSGLAIIPTASLAFRNADTHYPYRYDSYFYYLTGFHEPNAVLVLDANSSKTTLFCQEKNPDQEVWTGLRYGPSAACEQFGIDDAYAIDVIDTRMPELLAGSEALYWHIARFPEFDQQVAMWLNSVRSQARHGIEVPEKFGDVSVLLDEMRVIKDAEELACMRRAGQISAEGHVRAMRAARVGMYEYQLEAELLHTFVFHGARHCAYESIVAGGANACTLHYTDNKALLKEGDLVLIDAGCEYAGYASDITRTFPVNGKFSEAQRDVYQIVLAAQLAAIEAIAPGVTMDTPADKALRILVRGMLDLKLLTGSVEGNIESGAYRQFYMHTIGHMIGLDVHDVGKRKVKGHWCTYRPGMCTTVEPGLYIRPANNVPEALHNIGIRIEDDILVTDTGCEVYTATVPKNVHEIEALMSEA